MPPLGEWFDIVATCLDATCLEAPVTMNIAKPAGYRVAMVGWASDGGDGDGEGGGGEGEGGGGECEGGGGEGEGSGGIIGGVLGGTLIFGVIDEEQPLCCV